MAYITTETFAELAPRLQGLPGGDHLPNDIFSTPHK